MHKFDTNYGLFVICINGVGGPANHSMAPVLSKFVGSIPKKLVQYFKENRLKLKIDFKTCNKKCCRIMN